MTNSTIFKVNIQSSLSADDFKVIALLYQPILGIKGHSIYLTLYHLISRDNLSSKENNHQFLFDLLNVKLPDFIKERNKLEALGLLEVYEKKGSMIYFLKTPLSARQFLLDTVFGNYLNAEIGEKMTKVLSEYFKATEVDKTDYKNVTKQFDEMFDFNVSENLKIDFDIQGRSNNGGSEINDQFPFDEFVELVSTRAKKSQLLSLKLKEQLNRIAFVYKYDINDMIHIFNKSLKSDGIVNNKQLDLQAKLYFDSKNDCSKVIEVKEKNISTATYLDKVSPQDIIQKYGKTDHLGIALDTVNNILERNVIEIGVLNAILIRTLKFKDGILPNELYMEKVLDTFLKKGIKTTDDAIKFILNDTVESTSKKYTKDKKNLPATPDWFDDFFKSLER